MALLKCKMCGGDLEINEEITVAECEYCGTKQTVPTADNEKKLGLYTRANKLRAACDFDKAAGVYESIVAEFADEAEAYWGLILCRYGIEYVDDPATGKKIPTCHRSSFESIMESSDFEMVMENADAVSRKVYRDEAKFIEELRKSIIEVSSKEEPYDIFICYKETDENGDRTIDSAIAQDVYTALTEKGYRVFFSRITLEDKLGQEYEPYIFAALNSAKIMLAFGTDYEYYNAVWVKNEWSRFLQLIAKGEKKSLIPCYKNIDAYDMPKEFNKLQAQDMGKVGAIQDLLRGVEKLIGKSTPVQQVTEKVIVTQSGGPNVEALVKRGNMALEDGNFEQAKNFFNQVLNMNAECADAYLGLAMAEEKVCSLNINVFNLQNKNFLRAKQFADNELLNKIAVLEKNVLEEIRRKEEEQRKFEEERIRKEREAEEAKIQHIQKLAAIREKNKKVSNMIAAGGYHAVGLKSDGTVVAVGDTNHGEIAIKSCKDIVAVSLSHNHTVGLKSDGTVVAIGWNIYGQCDVSSWSDIVAVSASGYYTVGLKSDGTVVAVGENDYGQCDVSSWSDIVAVSAINVHTVGLKSDGTVVAVGSNKYGQCDVSSWSDIVAVSAGGYHTVGLKSDGTVVAVGCNDVGYNDNGRCNVKGWSDIVAIFAKRHHTVGLKSDGTVVAVGENDYGQCDVSSWSDIVAVYAEDDYTVGLKSDGTVVAVGKNDSGQCDVSSWSDIVAVSAGCIHTVGLKSDGTVVAVGKNDAGQCNVSDWKLFDNFDNLEEERKIKKEERIIKMQEAARQQQLIEQQKSHYRSQNLCQHCGGTFKGMFTKKCTSCGKEKDY